MASGFLPVPSARWSVASFKRETSSKTESLCQTLRQTCADLKTHRCGSAETGIGLERVHPSCRHDGATPQVVGCMVQQDQRLARRFPLSALSKGSNSGSLGIPRVAASNSQEAPLSAASAHGHVSVIERENFGGGIRDSFFFSNQRAEKKFTSWTGRSTRN
jgi:hypothetical protein